MEGGVSPSPFFPTRFCLFFLLSFHQLLLPPLLSAASSIHPLPPVLSSSSPQVDRGRHLRRRLQAACHDRGRSRHALPRDLRRACRLPHPDVLLLRPAPAHLLLRLHRVMVLLPPFSFFSPLFLSFSAFRLSSISSPSSYSPQAHALGDEHSKRLHRALHLPRDPGRRRGGPPAR